jgi:hypothetical protein
MKVCGPKFVGWSNESYQNAPSPSVCDVARLIVAKHSVDRPPDEKKSGEGVCSTHASFKDRCTAGPLSTAFGSKCHEEIRRGLTVIAVNAGSDLSSKSDHDAA